MTENLEPLSDEARESINDFENQTEDLGIKIGSKVQAKWTEILDKSKEAIMVDAMNIEISEAITKIAEKHISEEEAKNKTLK